MNLPKKKLPPEIQKWISASEPDYLLNWCTLDYSKAAVARLAISFAIYELKTIQALWITLELARKEFLEFEKFENAHLGAKEIARKLARIRKNPDEFPALFSSRLPSPSPQFEMALHSAPEIRLAISKMKEDIESLIRSGNNAISLALAEDSAEAEEPPYVDDFRRADPIAAAFLHFHQITLFDAVKPAFRKNHPDLFPEAANDGDSIVELPSLDSPPYQKYLCDLVEAHLQPIPFARRKNLKRYAWTARMVNFCCDEFEIPYSRNKEKNGIPSRLEAILEGCLLLHPLDEWNGVRNLIHRHNRKYWQAFAVGRSFSEDPKEPETDT